jgi:hypothetical protein
VIKAVPAGEWRHPAEFILETFLLSFFVVTVIWANEVKPGFLPDLLALVASGWHDLVDVLWAFAGAFRQLTGL